MRARLGIEDGEPVEPVLLGGVVLPPRLRGFAARVPVQARLPVAEIGEADAQRDAVLVRERRGRSDHGRVRVRRRSDAQDAVVRVGGIRGHRREVVERAPRGASIRLDAQPALRAERRRDAVARRRSRRRGRGRRRRCPRMDHRREADPAPMWRPGHPPAGSPRGRRRPTRGPRESAVGNRFRIRSRAGVRSGPASAPASAPRSSTHGAGGLLAPARAGECQKDEDGRAHGREGTYWPAPCAARSPGQRPREDTVVERAPWHRLRSSVWERWDIRWPRGSRRPAIQCTRSTAPADRWTTWRGWAPVRRGAPQKPRGAQR